MPSKMVNGLRVTQPLKTLEGAATYPELRQLL
jgi:hypothetical protein